MAKQPHRPRRFPELQRIARQDLGMADLATEEAEDRACAVRVHQLTTAQIRMALEAAYEAGFTAGSKAGRTW